MQIKDVMDLNIHLIGEDATLKEALVLLQESQQLEVFLVVNAETQLLGVVTQDDILRSFYPQYDEFGYSLPDPVKMEDHVCEVRDISMKALMQREYYRVTPYEPVLKVGSMMLVNNISHVPVVDLRGHAVGVVSQQTIVQELIKQSSLGQKMKVRTDYVEKPRPTGKKLKRFDFSETTKEFKEKRSEERVETHLNVNYEFAYSGDAPPGFDHRQSAMISDLSVGGAHVKLPQNIKADVILHLEFELPTDHKMVQCLARTTRISKSKKLGQSLTGVKFLALTTLDRQRVETYIRQAKYMSTLVPKKAKPHSGTSETSWLLFS